MVTPKVGEFRSIEDPKTVAHLRLWTEAQIIYDTVNSLTDLLGNQNDNTYEKNLDKLAEKLSSFPQIVRSIERSYHNALNSVEINPDDTSKHLREISNTLMSQEKIHKDTEYFFENLIDRINLRLKEKWADYHFALTSFGLPEHNILQIYRWDNTVKDSQKIFLSAA